MSELPKSVELLFESGSRVRVKCDLRSIFEAVKSQLLCLIAASRISDDRLELILWSTVGLIKCSEPIDGVISVTVDRTFGGVAKDENDGQRANETIEKRETKGKWKDGKVN